MKTTEQQIQDLIAAIEKQEGNIQVLQAKLSALVRKQRTEGTITAESAQGGAQLLQE